MNTLAMDFLTQFSVYLSIVHRDRGQSLVDYTLVIALIATLLIGVLSQFNGAVSGAFTRMITALGGSGF